MSKIDLSAIHIGMTDGGWRKQPYIRLPMSIRDFRQFDKVKEHLEKTTNNGEKILDEHVFRILLKREYARLN